MKKSRLLHYGLWAMLGLALGFGAKVSILWGIVVIVIVMCIDLSSFATGGLIIQERVLGAVDHMVMNAFHQENFEIEQADLEAQEESEPYPHSHYLQLSDR